MDGFFQEIQNKRFRILQADVYLDEKCFNDISKRNLKNLTLRMDKNCTYYIWVMSTRRRWN